MLGAIDEKNAKNYNIFYKNDQVRSAMNEYILNIFMKFKTEFYKKVFLKLKEREGSLTATEVFSLEILRALGRPTIGQFAEFTGISLPGATYKINSLVQKGYITKVISNTDRREHYIEFTEKARDYAALEDEFADELSNRVEERFTKEEREIFLKMLKVINDEMI